jgi:hypothetical protein
MDKFIYYILFPEIPTQKRYLLAGIYVAILVAGAILLGAFSYSGIDYEIYIRMRNATVGQPLYTAFIWLAHTFIFFGAKRAIDKFSLALDEDTSFDKHKTLAKLTRTSIRNFKFAVLLGILTTGAYNMYEGLLHNSPEPLLIYLVVSAVPFWIACWLLVLQLYTITHHIINEIIKGQTLDLFGLKTLLPLGDQFISFIIIAAILFALSPVFWIGKQVPLIDMMLLAALFIFLCIFFFRPILNIQNRMYHKKKLAVNRINLSIQDLLHIKQEGNRRLTDDPQRLRQLSALINAKSEITNTSEWAISVPQQIRGSVIVVSIPLSWAVASMIETIIGKLAPF